MNPPNTGISRREFIGQASCAGVGATALFSTLLSLRLANSLAAQTAPAGSDYKALVCLFLAGGNDSFNMLVPTTAGEYQAYGKIRGNLALAQDTLLQIKPGNLGGRTLGIHPAMTEVRDLFNAGHLSFVSNVGSLVRPTTLADYKSGRYRPVSLYSHADQVKQWQHLLTNNYINTAVTGAFMVLVLLVVAVCMREWWLLLGKRREPVLREEPYVAVALSQTR